MAGYSSPRCVQGGGGGDRLAGGSTRSRIGRHEPYKNTATISCAIHVTWTNQHQTGQINKAPDYIA